MLIDNRDDIIRYVNTCIAELDKNFKDLFNNTFISGFFLPDDDSVFLLIGKIKNRIIIYSAGDDEFGFIWDDFSKIELCGELKYAINYMNISRQN